MKIIFVSNWDKTIIFNEIAQRIKSKYDIYFLVFSQKWYQFLLDQGWSKSKLLYLPWDELSINKTENELPTGLGARQLISFDRYLKFYPEKSYNYLLNVIHEFENFVDPSEKYNIYGELTWAHELLIFRFTQKYLENSTYLKPHTVRLPSNKWGFFDSEDESSLVKRPIESFSNLSFEKNDTDYFKRNLELRLLNSKFKSLYGKVINFITSRNIESSNPTVLHDRIIRFLIGVRTHYNEVYKNFFVRDKTYKVNNNNNKRYFLVALHVQPEASVDVIGRESNDQLMNIRLISNILEANDILLVKEHPNAFGNRAPFFYKSLKRLKNVYIINNNLKASTLFKFITAVFSVSGTISYEAALKNIKSYTLSKVFFNKLEYCNYLSQTELRNLNSIDELLNKKLIGLNKMEWEKFMTEFCYEGNWDPFSEITFTKDNLEILTNAISNSN